MGACFRAAGHQFVLLSGVSLSKKYIHIFGTSQRISLQTGIGAFHIMRDIFLTYFDPPPVPFPMCYLVTLARVYYEFLKG